MRRFFILSCFLFLLSAGTQGLAASPPSAEPDPLTLTPTPILTIAQKKNIRVVYDIKGDVWDAGIGKVWSTEDLMPGVRVVHGDHARLIDLPQQGYAYIRF